MILPFCLALFGSAFSTVFFPELRILAFAPFFAICYSKKSFSASLWIATLCGSILDLISSEHRFGLYAFTSCMTTLLIYHQKSHFFDDKPIGLTLFTGAISIVYSSILLILLCGFDKNMTLSWNLILTDVLGMSFVDALYAFLWFTCPIRGYVYIQRRIRDIKLKKADEDN